MGEAYFVEASSRPFSLHRDGRPPTLLQAVTGSKMVGSDGARGCIDSRKTGRSNVVVSFSFLTSIFFFAERGKYRQVWYRCSLFLRSTFQRILR